MNGQRHTLKHIHHDLMELHRKVDKMAGEMEAAVARIEATVTPLTNAVLAVKALIVTLVQAVKDAAAAGGTAPEVVARVNAVADSAAANVDDLVAATLAGTPVAPAKV